MANGILVLVTIALWLALAGAVRYALHPMLAEHRSSRAPLPRHAGQTRPATPVAAPDEGSAPPVAGPEAGPPVPPAVPAAPAAAPQAGATAAGALPLCVETHPLYLTGAQPVLSQEAADEIWWSL